jgi:hypothetical protein
MLLSSGPVKGQLLALAASAIATTLIGSYLALGTALGDWLDLGRRESPPPLNSGASTTAAAGGSTSATTENGARRSTRSPRWVVAALAVVPSLAVAASSPDLFLKAIDFAGSYPVLLLWGIAPPVMALLRRSQRASSSSSSAGPSAWLALLAAVSAALMLSTVIPDVAWLLAAASALRS